MEGSAKNQRGQRQRSPPRWPLPFGMLAGGLAGFISETDAGGGFGHMGLAAMPLAMKQAQGNRTTTPSTSCTISFWRSIQSMTGW